MAGLWELIKRDTAASEPHLSSHKLDNAIVFYSRGHYTAGEARTAIENSIGRALTTAEIDDLTAIVTVMDGKSGATNKMVYNTEIKAACNEAETGAIDETKWRSVLGI